jgi:hypothetical protein
VDSIQSIGRNIKRKKHLQQLEAAGPYQFDDLLGDLIAVNKGKIRAGSNKTILFE